MEERQHAEADVVGAIRRPGCACTCSMLRAQVAVREHRRLRRAGGARREQQDREVVAGAVDGQPRAGPAQGLDRAGTVERAEQQRRLDRAELAAASSGSGEPGLSGTATAPAVSVAR